MSLEEGFESWPVLPPPDVPPPWGAGLLSALAELLGLELSTFCPSPLQAVAVAATAMTSAAVVR
ncbi:hypothetical protein GCM10020000_08540 [Streptomyces olivoverticillatus]